MRNFNNHYLRRTWDDVDIGATPKFVALSPFGCLAEEPESAVTAFESLRQVDLIAYRPISWNALISHGATHFSLWNYYSKEKK